MLTDNLRYLESSFLARERRMSETKTNVHDFESKNANVIIGGAGGGIEFVKELGIGI